MKVNVPPLLQQIRENMLDKTNSQNVRHNYYQTMLNIKEFCDRAVTEYNKTANKKG